MKPRLGHVDPSQRASAPRPLAASRQSSLPPAEVQSSRSTVDHKKPDDASALPPAVACGSDCDSTNQLATWEYAGLMVTYWCNAKCAFCYVYSAPDRGGDMSLDDAIRMWRGLDELAAGAGKPMRIHLAGGEPMGDWPRLVSIIRAARDAGLSKLEKVETNAYWATHDGLVRSRIELLDALGIERLVVSTDVFHQEFIDPARVARCVRIARQVLGPTRVRVRWWEFLNRPLDVRRLPVDKKEALFAASLEHHNDRMTGRAALRLAPLLPRQPAEAFASLSCTREVLQSQHVHIDAYGNVFPGVCSGIVLGNVSRTPIPQFWEHLSRTWPQHPVVGPVVRGGSYALMKNAMDHGYRPDPSGYTDKCHLCFDVRQFLFDHGICPDAVGPAECYANAADRADAKRWNEAVELTRQGQSVKSTSPIGAIE